MTTSEAAYRLLRHCVVSDFAALTVSQGTELMGALGYAVGEYFRFGPAMLRQTTASATLPGPKTVTGMSIAAGGLEVTSGTPFGLSQRGASLEIAGDTNVNEIVSTVGWLNPYQGSTGSGKSGIVYGDCVPISSRIIERLLSDPWILDNSGRSDARRTLQRIDDEHREPSRTRNTNGTPSYYAIQPTGVSRGATTQWLMRVWPRPEEQLVIRFECEVQPDMFDRHNISEVVLDLPFPDVQMETIILPLAEERLMASTLLDEISDRIAATLTRDADRARGHLRAIPRDHGKPAGRLRTRHGF